MTYTTSAAVKAYLSITDTSFDAIISQLVSDADVEINSVLDIDGFDAATKTNEVVSFKNLYVYDGGYYNFPVYNLNVQTLTHINGTAYTWTKWVGDDYYIKFGRLIYIDDIYNYVNDTSFDMFTVTYTYWWSTLPSDVVMLARLRVARAFREMHPMYAVSTNQLPWVSSYQLADERIQFNQDRFAKDDQRIDAILAKYKKVHVF